MAEWAHKRIGPFEQAVAELEQAAHVYLAPSGLAAISQTILALVSADSHILVTDNVYDPVRGFCDRTLARLGVVTEYYDPRIGDAISEHIKPDTALVLAESPGSLTFEVQDIPAMAEACSRDNVPLIVDNTWSAGLYFKPLAYGATVSIQSATKYLAGHSDCMLGTIAVQDDTISRRLGSTLRQLGSCVSPDDVVLAHRGMRTLGVRLPQHEKTALHLAKWFQEQKNIETVLHPALETHPDHALWKEQFSGSSGLFGVQLKACSEQQLASLCNTMTYFGMGYSWGGFESLMIPVPVHKYRSAMPYPHEGPLLRVHAGLEHPCDLVHDLEMAFAAFEAAG